MALLDKSQGRLVAARRHYRRALAIFKGALGVKHPHYVACARNLARLEKNN